MTRTHIAHLRGRWWAQAVAFSAVGIANTAVDALVFALLVQVLGWTSGGMATMASATGFVAGSVHSYLWNSRVTFGLRGRRDSTGIATQFAAVTAVGLILTSVTFATITTTPVPFGLVTAKAAAVVVGAGWNFWLLRHWVFARD